MRLVSAYVYAIAAIKLLGALLAVGLFSAAYGKTRACASSCCWSSLSSCCSRPGVDAETRLHRPAMAVAHLEHREYPVLYAFPIIAPPPSSPAPSPGRSCPPCA